MFALCRASQAFLLRRFSSYPYTYPARFERVSGHSAHATSFASTASTPRRRRREERQKDRGEPQR
jgi:hypothetical protein